MGKEQRFVVLVGSGHSRPHHLVLHIPNTKPKLGLGPRLGLLAAKLSKLVASTVESEPHWDNDDDFVVVDVHVAAAQVAAVVVRVLPLAGTGEDDVVPGPGAEDGAAG